jgi:hypothetical protein
MEIELAISADLKLAHEYEVVWLKKGSETIVVGDHYGDPVAGIIDQSREWCASFGEGVIVYWLKQPFSDYSSDTKSEQWLEWGRDHFKKFVSSARQSGPFELEVITDEDGIQSSHTLRFSKTARTVSEV